MNDRTAIHGPGRDRMIEELFARADELAPSEWENFLERECPDDPELCTAILSALRGAARAGGGFLTSEHYDRELADPPWIGKYEIVRRIGESSGQAAAFLGYDPDLRRHVVLKQYLDCQTLEGRRAMIDEGRALAGIKSDFVAECLGIEFLGDQAFLVVEHIKGRTLAEARSAGPLELDRIAGIMTHLAEGVAKVHERGLIHRDIKPANVILGDDGRPRLIDFGLVTQLCGDRLRERAGTPNYMAVEQARGEPERIDFRTDVFGLGAVLYSLLTGRAPYEAASTPLVIALACDRALLPPRQLVPSIPEPVEAVCLKAMAAAPGDRYPTALEFAAELERAIAPRPRRLMANAAAPWVLACGILVLALGAVFWSSSLRNVPASPTARSEESGPASLDIKIEMRHFRELKNNKARFVGTVSEASLASDPPKVNDLIRVYLTTSKPVDGYLFALNPDGEVQLALPLAAGNGHVAHREWVFPEAADKFFRLDSGAGLLAFVVVAADAPLPSFDEWKAGIKGGLRWSPLVREGFWTYNSNARMETRRLSGRVRGKIVQRETALDDMTSVFDRLRLAPGVVQVHAVAFPVKTDDDLVK